VSARVTAAGQTTSNSMTFFRKRVVTRTPRLPRSDRLPRSEEFAAANSGRRREPGTFGAASKPRIFDAAERREIEARLRAEGRL
jgi:hypothetical protein